MLIQIKDRDKNCNLCSFVNNGEMKETLGVI